MHIAFLNPQGNFDPLDRGWTAHADFGGQLVYVKETALALGRLGHRVDLVTRRIVDPDWAGFESRLDRFPGEPHIRILRVDCGGERFLRKEDLWPHLGEWAANIQAWYAREGRRPDLVSAHYGDGGLAAALWQQRGGPDFTFTGHSLGALKLDRLQSAGAGSLPQLDGAYHFARRIAAERTAVSRASRVITSTRQEQVEQYSHPAYRQIAAAAGPGHFATVPPGVNLRIFDPAAHGAEDDRAAAAIDAALARQVDSARRGLPAVICSSRLETQKNHLGLLRAFACSPELQACANLVLSVRGLTDLRQWQELSRKLAPAEHILLSEMVSVIDQGGLWGKTAALTLDSQQDLAAAYRCLARRRSVFILPSLHETFGLAPLEAMAAGLPAVVTNRGGPLESLHSAETGMEYGVLVNPYDPAEIARGLLRLVGPGGEWDRFQQAGRQRVLERYTWERTAAGYLRVFEDLANTPPRAGLSIPAYFTHPTPENDLPLSTLAF